MEETSFYEQSDLRYLGLKDFGEKVRISRKASIYGASQISIGDNVRIDDFVILSGSIQIGSFIHLGAYSSLFGKYGILMQDFSGVSSRVTVLSASDDFSGEYLTNSAVIDSIYCKTVGSEVVFERHANVGTGSTILPGVHLAEGTVIGAMSLASTNTEPWTIYFGIPCRAINTRRKDLLKLEGDVLNSCKLKK